MSSKKNRKDYSITEQARINAEENGLLSAEWYICPIPRKRLKELMKRKDGPAIRDTILWFGSLLVLGFIAYQTLWTWWSIPAFFLYGIFYITPAVSRWHECSHGTPFKTPWMNEALYQIASFMALKPATVTRWSHSRHHTDTIIVGVDPEIVAPRPPIWHILFLELGRLYGGMNFLRHLIPHCFGKLSFEEKQYIPESQINNTIWEARIWVVLLLGMILWSISIQSIIPLLFIGLPTFYGSVLMFFLACSQHLGLHENVLDHRLNSRTFYTNPIIRFLYWNMNYHIEHHMFPMVPYHALPALHEEIKHDCPPACPNFFAACKEVVVALWKQRIDPDYVNERYLPEQSEPYLHGQPFHNMNPSK